jgi:hypothetical protein
MLGRTALATVALVFVPSLALPLAPSWPARPDACPASTVDIADWPIVRSPRVPGFTLRLPRTFTRDSARSTSDSAPAAHWSDAARGRLTLSHRADNDASPIPSANDGAKYVRCETRVGSATATIVSYDVGTSTYVLHAEIRWPDGEALDVHASAADRAHLAQLLAAVRTIRRAGA